MDGVLQIVLKSISSVFLFSKKQFTLHFRSNEVISVFNGPLPRKPLTINSQL